jgi:hypothetical protein
MVHWCGCAGLVGLVGTSYFSELLFEMFLSNVSVTNAVALALNSQETQRGLPCTPGLRGICWEKWSSYFEIGMHIHRRWVHSYPGTG